MSNLPFYNTVFNPTVNGPLHLGHIYLMRVNEQETKGAPGKFFVRYDDTQEYWAERIGYQEVSRYKALMVEDAAWMGVKVDGWYSQSEMQIEARERLAARCHSAGIPIPVDHYVETFFPETSWSKASVYPYAAYKTAEKAIFDDMLDISLKIRGEDLYGEYALYAYFREMFRMFQPRQVFLPRLRFAHNGGVGEVSKTLNTGKISDLRRARADPGVIERALRVACLREPNGLWAIENLKPDPVYREDAQ